MICFDLFPGQRGRIDGMELAEEFSPWSVPSGTARLGDVPASVSPFPMEAWTVSGAEYSQCMPELVSTRSGSGNMCCVSIIVQGGRDEQRDMDWCGLGQERV